MQKQGWTLLSSSSATWHQLFGLDFYYLAFSCYLQQIIFNWAFVPGRRFSNSLPSQILNVVRHACATLRIQNILQEINFKKNKRGR